MYLIENAKYLKDLENAIDVLSFEKEKTILVTGASGLIGSFIIDSLIYYNQKHEVKVNIIGMSRDINKLNERFAYCKAEDRVTLISHDICSYLPDDKEYDIIVHAASNADPKTYALYPVETINTNVIGTINVLEYAKKHTGTKVLFTSTIETYGEINNSDILTEDKYGLIDFNQIRSGYPESKRVSELLCRSYALEYEVNVTIARLGYIYGPSMTKTDSKVVAQFIKNIINYNDIVLKSSGKQKRSYCYVSDAVSAMFYLLINGKKGEAYNIANSGSITTIENMAKIAAGLSGTEVIYDIPDEIERKGFSKTLDAVLEESKIRELGWTPKYSLADGLKRTVEVLQEVW